MGEKSQVGSSQPVRDWPEGVYVYLIEQEVCQVHPV